MSDRHGRPNLAVVPSLAPEVQTPSVAFCSHCGARESAGVTPAKSRVCANCEMGLLLEASEAIAPREGDAFVILDSALAVCGVSGAAEELLAASETEVVNRHVTELLVPADAEAESRVGLAVAITWAARGDGSVRRVTVRPANTFGVRLTARIASCGPPRAALLVFD